jgi:hypothetical protein
MAHIVFEEQRPFTYRDFLHFKVSEKEYGMVHGTFRNKISKLMKSKEVELAYNSSLGFYTLKGLRFVSKPMTGTHMGGLAKLSSDPIVRMIESLPMQRNALHDIRLRFSADGLWSTVSVDSRYMIDPFSKDIRLQPYKICNLTISVVVHHTDTVSVSIGCSSNPIAVGIHEVIRLSNALTRIEERLSSLVSAEGEGGAKRDNLISIPEYRTWIVTMWHFGADGSKEYFGETFSVTWEIAEHVLIRAYSKEMIAGGNKNKKTHKIVRLERQEYPNKTFEEAIEEKLGGF